MSGQLLQGSVNCWKVKLSQKCVWNPRLPITQTREGLHCNQVMGDVPGLHDSPMAILSSSIAGRYNFIENNGPAPPAILTGFVDIIQDFLSN